MTVAILEKPHPPQVTGCFLIQSLGRKLLFVQPGLGNLEEALQSGSYCVGQAVQGENWQQTSLTLYGEGIASKIATANIWELAMC